MISNKNSFVRGATSGYIYTLISLLVALWMVPFVLRYLSKPEYGIFAIIGDLVAWLGVANLGITSAFNSKAAQLIGSANRKELDSLVTTTFIGQLATSTIIVILGIVIYFNPGYLFGDSILIEDIEIVISLLVFSFYLQYVNQPLAALLVADKQVHVDNYIKIFILFIQTLLTVILLTNGFKLFSLAISSLSSNALNIIITWFRVKLSFPDLEFKISNFSKDKMFFLLRNGLWFTMGGLAGILIFRMDAYLIGQYLSLTYVATFVINNRLYQISERIHGQLFNTSRPYLSQTFGIGDLGKLSRIYNFIYFSSFVSAFVIGVLVYLFSEWFIGMWVGPENYLGDKINLFLCINFVIQAVVLPNRILLASTLYKIKIHNLSRVIDGLVRLLLAILLVNYFGLVGILFASILSSLLFSNILLNLLSAEFLGETFWNKLIPLLPVLSLGLMFVFNDNIFKFIIIISAFISLLLITVKHILDFDHPLAIKWSKILRPY